MDFYQFLESSGAGFSFSSLPYLSLEMSGHVENKGMSELAINISVFWQHVDSAKSRKFVNGLFELLTGDKEKERHSNNF